MRFNRWLLSCALVVLATACGKDSDSGTGPTTLTPAVIEITSAKTSLAALGDTLRLAARVLDKNGEVVPGVGVAWSSSDTAVAVISGAGLVTARGNGNATMTAAAEQISGEVTVTVQQGAKHVNVTPSADTLFDGQSTTLGAAVSDGNGHALLDAAVTWTSSDTSIATVDSLGVVLARYPGTVTIAASAGVGRGQATIIVRPVATRIVVASGADHLAVAGDTLAGPLQFRVIDRHDLPVSGHEVHLTLPSGNGNLREDRMTTEADGIIGVQFDISSEAERAEPLTVRAEISLAQGTDSVSVTFHVRRPVLYYSRWNGAGYELIRYDWLTQQAVVTSTTGSIINAAPAPNGSAIAYSAYNYQTGYYDLYLHDWAAADAKLIHSSATGHSRAATFSTDGRYIAFEVGDRCYSMTTIALYDLAADALVNKDLARSSCAITPAFLSATTLVYAEFGADNYDLWQMAVPSGNVVRVTATPDVDEYYPFRITDKRLITGCASLYQELLDLCALDLDGSNRVQLTSTPNQSEWDPTVSYNGAWFAFTVTVPGFDPEIRVSPSKGGAITRLPGSTGTDQRYPAFGLIGWNPNGDADVTAATAGVSFSYQPAGPRLIFAPDTRGTVVPRLRETPFHK